MDADGSPQRVDDGREPLGPEDLDAVCSHTGMPDFRKALDRDIRADVDGPLLWAIRRTRIRRKRNSASRACRTGWRP